MIGYRGSSGDTAPMDAALRLVGDGGWLLLWICVFRTRRTGIFFFFFSESKVCVRSEIPWRRTWAWLIPAGRRPAG